MCKRRRLTVMAILLLSIAGVEEEAACGGVWQKTEAGKFDWFEPANWDQVPNAPGTVANLSVDLAGDQTISLSQPVTIGTLATGDIDGNFKVKIIAGSSANVLTFEGAKIGSPATINVNTASLAAVGSELEIAGGVKLGGKSPLTVHLNGTADAVSSIVINTLDLNGNILTINGLPIPAPLIAPRTTFNPGLVRGSGSFVQNGGTVEINHQGGGGALSNFTGSITLNGGYLGINFDNGLSAVSQITLAGVFQKVNKYPVGGMMNLGSTGAIEFGKAMPDRFNHNGILTFNSGGYLAYNGAILAGDNAGKDLVEQVKQIQFNTGMSELRILNGNGSSSSTTLLANDPVKSFFRQQGATMMIGGDDSASGGGRFWRAMGVKEKLVFKSGMASELKGGGGAPDSTTQSIIPWMVVGTIYHPGQGGFLTYDPINGVHAMHPEEYYRGDNVMGASDTENVFESDLNLGKNRTKKINAYRTSGWGNTDIGPGSTLIVTSGAIQFNGTISAGGGSIGNSNPANAGTIDFRSAEGIIWAGFNSQVHGDGQPGDAIIGSVIAGSGGLTKTGSNVLRLTGANMYTGKTIVNSGELQIGNGILTTSKLGKGDIEITPGSTLTIAANVANGIADSAKVTLDNNGTLYYGTMNLADGVKEKVRGLVLGGIAQKPGTYGSSASGATYKMDDYFSGPGILAVVP